MRWFIGGKEFIGSQRFLIGLALSYYLKNHSISHSIDREDNLENRTMLKLFALLILLTLPYQGPQDLATALMTDIVVGCEGLPHAESPYLMGSYNGQYKIITICENDLIWHELKHTVIHELQHHMQLTERVYARPCGYRCFLEDVLYEMETGDYSEDVIKTVHYLIRVDEDNGSYAYSELHAELPWVLNMEMPESLQEWYPWFEWDKHSST